MYECQRCGYETKRKNNFTRHTNRKIKCIDKCNNNNLITDSNNCLQKLSKLELVIENNCLQKTPIRSQKIIKKLECQFCMKVFTRKNNLVRHEKNRCKENKLIRDLKEQMNEITKLIKDMPKTTTNIVNNIQQNIIIRDFGKENLELLTDDVLNQMIQGPIMGIQRLFEFIHFNPNTPENKNITIKTNKIDKILTHEDGEWIEKPKEQVLEQIIEQNVEIMDKYYDKNGEKILPLNKQNTYKYYREHTEERLEDVPEMLEISIQRKLGIE